jgi:hypothetical protein
MSSDLIQDHPLHQLRNVLALLEHQLAENVHLHDTR